MTITIMNGKIFDVDTGDEIPHSYTEHKHCPESTERLYLEGLKWHEVFRDEGRDTRDGELCGCGTIILEENE